MVQSELDSFYYKFKNLFRAEKDATLTLKSEVGRAVITMSVNLGHYHHPRYWPARQRQHEKHAAASEERVAVEEESLSAKKQEMNQMN